MNENKTTFRAGVCMAGAVSAGAYTAGVMDYLFEVLDNWEKAKELQLNGMIGDIPKHNFIIEVLSGASAGGMTAAISAAAVQCSFPHVKQENIQDTEVTQKNPLYNSWVNLTESDSRDMMDIMLCTDDIENDPENPRKEVRAGFNSTFIPQVASSIIDKAVKDPNCRRPYIAEDADIFTTVTNLRGFNYEVSFMTNQGQRKHRMRMHKDYVFFRLDGNGKYEGDGRIPLSFNDEKGLNKELLKQAAMATGAFPVGLESRELVRSRAHIADNRYLNLKLNGIEKDVDYSFLPEDPFLSLNVDGGVINNEPFETTQQVLNDRRRKEILKKEGDVSVKNFVQDIDLKNFDSMVLMVDPFPNDDEPQEQKFTPRKAWRNAVPAILSAMRGQLMMKDEEIKKAYHPEDYTRFLISPVRSKDKQKQKYAIACGAFGGFGGFFCKKFREHDFFLGRRNCQRFIQKHFSVPFNPENTDENNPIINFGYINCFDSYKLQINGKEYLPIIPDIRIVKDELNGEYRVIKPAEEKEYSYPQVSLSYLLGLQKKIEKRLACIMDNITNVVEADKSPENEIVKRIRKKSWFGAMISRVQSGITGVYLSIGKSFAKGPAAQYFLDAVIADMHKRELLLDDYKK